MNNLPTSILSCACITAFCVCITALLLIFKLSRIVTALGNIRVTLDIIHRDLVMLFESKRKTIHPSSVNTGATRTGSAIGGRKMHKIFLAVSSMIVTGFLMKSYRKLREKPESNPGTKDELHRRMRAAYERLKIESRRAAARTTFARMDAISTPRDGGLVDALLQMAPGRFT